MNREDATGSSSSVEEEDEFLSWCQAHSVQTSLQIHCFPTTCRGLMATADIQPHELLVSVPLNACLSSLVYNHGPFARCFDEYRLHHDSRLKLTLLMERWKQQRSDWAAYIRSLPNSYDSVEYFTRSDTEQLQFAQLKQQVGTLQQECRLEYNRMARFCRQQLHGRVLSADEFKWASATVRTRACYFDIRSVFGELESNTMLVPYFDLLNHTELQCQARYDPRTESVCISTDRAVAAGGEAFICYHRGADNVFLLLEYGFISQSSDADTLLLLLVVYEVGVPYFVAWFHDLNRQNGVVAVQQQQQQLEGMWKEEGKCFIDADGEPSVSFLGLLRCIAQWQTTGFTMPLDQVKPYEYYSRSQSEQVERLAHEYLIRFCRHELAQCATSEQEDELYLSKHRDLQHVSYRSYCIVYVRWQLKRVLNRCLLLLLAAQMDP